MIKKPKILIFDEATSSLDINSEEIILKSINYLLQNSKCTIIIIAHKLKLIKNCEKIIVFQNGAIIEYGSH